jgi:hypothetical protein
MACALLYHPFCPALRTAQTGPVLLIDVPDDCSCCLQRWGFRTWCSQMDSKRFYHLFQWVVPIESGVNTTKTRIAWLWFECGVRRRFCSYLLLKSSLACAFPQKPNPADISSRIIDARACASLPVDSPFVHCQRIDVNSTTISTRRRLMFFPYR